MPSKFVPLFVLLLVPLLGSLAPDPVRATDEFYVRLFERGVQDLELGLADEARKKLRTASFGFLDEPVLLAEALMQLGRAQILGGDSGDLTDTVLRLVEIENRFGAYSKASGDVRAVFESALRNALPEAFLGRLPLFEHLIAVPEPTEEQAQPLTPKQRKKSLERQLAANPEDREALLALSRLYHANGKHNPAGKLLERLLALQPENREALCLRADIGVERKECAPALAGVDLCPSLAATDRAAVVVLDCLTQTGRSPEASAFLARLPAELRQTPKIVRAARKIAAPVEEDGARPAAPPLDEPTTAGPSSEGDPPDPTGPSPTDSDKADLEEEERIDPVLEERIALLRTQVKESRFREQLEDALEQVSALANDHPDSAQAQYLAAETAYLAARWQLASDYFARAPRPGADRPELLFYLAVATFELGNADEAASILREALPSLARSPFVDTYIDKILPTPPS